MAVFCEQSAVLALFEERAEMFLSSKNDIGASVMAESPPDSGFDSSPGIERPITRKPASEQQTSSQTSSGQSSTSTDASRGVVIQFNRTPNKQTTVEGLFQKQPIVPISGPSALTEEIRSQPSSLLNLSIFMPKTIGGSVRVRVPDSETVEGIIRAALRRYTEENRTPALTAPQTNAATYQLRLAEADGTPDDDMPLLGPKTQINSKLGNTFVLCPLTASGKDSAKDRAIRITLPDNQKALMPITPGAKVGELMRKICSKRGIAPTDYYFRLASSPAPLNGDLLLEELKENELQLLPYLASTTSENTEEDETLWTDAIAFRYKLYNLNLVRIKAVDRASIGIDGERIIIQQQQKKKTTMKTLDTRLISEVASARLSADKPKVFSIEWVDGKTDTFEADSLKEAREIVGKIDYIYTHRSRR